MSNSFSIYDLLKQVENAEPGETAKVFNNAIIKKSTMQKKPITAHLELLPICNLNCKVCYIRMTIDEVKQSGHHILGFDEWKYYIDEAEKLGVSSLTFTGGECTIHPDFIKIYKYAYQKGFQLGLISNGTNITPDILNLFKQLPPTKVFITLYGMSNVTYERFCGVKVFDRVIKNIESLCALNINVILNYTVGKDNLYDLEKAFTYARNHKLSIFPNNSLLVTKRFTPQLLKNENADYYIYERLEHEHLSKHYNMTVEDYEKEFYHSVNVPNFQRDTKGLQCNAGRCQYCINWKGEMQPCVSIYWHSVAPKKVGGMEQAWKSIVAWADEVPVLEDCKTCIFQNKCRRCVALHYGDMGEYGKVSPRFCFKVLHPEEAAKLQAEYDRRQALKKAEETEE